MSGGALMWPHSGASSCAFSPETVESRSRELVKMSKIMNSPKRLARIAGVLYLLNAIFSSFALLFADRKVYVASNATTTARNLVAHAALVRMGVVADLIQATLWIFLAMTLYLLLKHVNRSAAGAMVVLVAIGTAIVCLNAVFRFESLRVATGHVGSAALGTAGSNALALLLLDTQHYGILIAQIFFGLWLLPLGYLAYRSGMFPKVLGIALIMGGACYLVDTFALFLVPSVGKAINGSIVIPAAIAEISMVAYLLVIGARTARPAVQAERECGGRGFVYSAPASEHFQQPACKPPATEMGRQKMALSGSRRHATTIRRVLASCVRRRPRRPPLPLAPAVTRYADRRRLPIVSPSLANLGGSSDGQRTDAPMVFIAQ